MNKYLVKLANHLDKKGLYKEADYVDWIIKKAMTPGVIGHEGGVSYDTAPQQSQHIAKRPRDSANMALEALIGLVPGVGTAIDGAHIVRTMQKLEAAYNSGNLAEAAELEKELAINGGLALMSVIPFARLGKAAKTLKVDTKTVTTLKKKVNNAKNKPAQKVDDDMGWKPEYFEDLMRKKNDPDYMKSLNDEFLDDEIFDKSWKMYQEIGPKEFDEEMFNMIEMLYTLGDAAKKTK